MLAKKNKQHQSLLYTITIELLNGKMLVYRVDEYSMEELEEWLRARTNGQTEYANDFLCVYAIPDRISFVRIESIVRIVFCWDAINTVEGPQEYHDHFGVASKFEDELSIPPVIILLKNSGVVEFPDADPDDDFLGIDEESFSNDNFLKGGFITLSDEDGEQNYIPVVNIDCMEVDRAFIYPDNIWKEMKKMRKVEDKN